MIKEVWLQLKAVPWLCHGILKLYFFYLNNEQMGSLLRLILRNPLQKRNHLRTCWTSERLINIRMKFSILIRSRIKSNQYSKTLWANFARVKNKSESGMKDKAIYGRILLFNWFSWHERGTSHVLKIPKSSHLKINYYRFAPNFLLYWNAVFFNPRSLNSGGKYADSECSSKSFHDPPCQIEALKINFLFDMSYSVREVGNISQFHQISIIFSLV